MERLLQEAEFAKRNVNTANIPGWGMDADPENDPTYPMKNRKPGVDHEGMSYEKAPQQNSNVKIFHSNERPSVTRVFGTSTPPSGLSGWIRSKAFEHSEATTAHWMTLVLADRVNVVEEFVGDIRRGKFPNFIAELGWRAEWDYNRKNFVTRISAYALGVAAFVLLVRRKRSA